MQDNEMNTLSPAGDVVDRFSWHRVGMIVRYWWPLLRLKLLMFLIISIVVGLTAVSFYRVYNDYAVMQITGLTTYLCIFGSAVFGKKGGHQMRVGLPARNSEKLTFLLIFNLLVLPLVTVVPCSLIMWLVDENPFHLVMNVIGINDPVYFFITAQIFSYLMMLVASMVCMWTATTARRSAFLKAICFSLITFVAPSFLTGLLIGLNAFKELGLQVAQQDFITHMVTDMSWTFTVLTPILALVWVTCLCFFIKDFKRRQC